MGHNRLGISTHQNVKELDLGGRFCRGLWARSMGLQHLPVYMASWGGVGQARLDHRTPLTFMGARGGRRQDKTGARRRRDIMLVHMRSRAGSRTGRGTPLLSCSSLLRAQEPSLGIVQARKGHSTGQHLCGLQPGSGQTEASCNTHWHKVWSVPSWARLQYLLKTAETAGGIMPGLIEALAWHAQDPGLRVAW